MERKILFGVFRLLILFIILTGCAGQAKAKGYTNPATIKEGVQYVQTDFTAGSYTPITVQVGVPVKWSIEIDSKDLNNCNGEFSIPQFDIHKGLMAGENVVEFTPDKTGTIPYSCWMGMIRSEIIVVDDLAKSP